MTRLVPTLKTAKARFWATYESSATGKAHLWRESGTDASSVISECGLVVFSRELQGENQIIGRCMKCGRCE